MLLLSFTVLLFVFALFVLLNVVVVVALAVACVDTSPLPLRNGSRTSFLESDISSASTSLLTSKPVVSITEEFLEPSYYLF